jgi:dihydroflavonol-4-reductase
MNLLVIGGSGLLGTFTVNEALRRGHVVTGLSRTVRESSGGVRWLAGDVTRMTEAQLREACEGQEALVYALGLDDREPRARPSYPVFFEDHVTVCTRVGRVAREAGVKKFVVFGSYFTHFDQTQPELAMARHHPYVRARCEQRDAVLALAGPGFDAYVLELPYIIGSLPKSVPPWTFLFSMLASPGPVALFFTRGGTAAVTARQVAQASLGAIEGSAVSGAYPLGGVNWTWVEWARQFFAAAGFTKRVWGLPAFAFVLFGAISSWVLALRGLQRGLAIGAFAKVQYMNAFVDPRVAQEALGYSHDAYEHELKALVAEWQQLRG